MTSTHHATLLSAAFVLSFWWMNGCGDADEDTGGTPATGGSTGDASTDSPSTPDSETPDASDATTPVDAGPETQAYDPCATAKCWDAPTLGRCGSVNVKETFSSGAYNAHHFLVMAPAGVQIDLTATPTAGTWAPVLIVHDEQGSTVHDGQKSHSTPALEVSALAPPSPGAVGVRIRAATRMHLGVYLTGASVVSSGFSDALPTDAKYTLSSAFDCAPPAPLVVRGVQLDAEQDLWVRYIGEHVVPKVPGTAAERIDKSAYVTWWALKEGVLNVNNAISYSNCSIPPDKHIGAVEVCPNPKNAWQVGLSGVQATYNTLAELEPLALSMYSPQTLTEILTDSAVTAGFGASTSIAKAVASSQDRLRISWLLRNGPIGFEAQYQPVHDQCFVSSLGWCFGTGWPSTASFAPSQAAAKQSVADLKAIFQGLAP